MGLGNEGEGSTMNDTQITRCLYPGEHPFDIACWNRGLRRCKVSGNRYVFTSEKDGSLVFIGTQLEFIKWTEE